MQCNLLPPPVPFSTLSRRLVRTRTCPPPVCVWGDLSVRVWGWYHKSRVSRFRSLEKKGAVAICQAMKRHKAQRSCWFLVWEGVIEKCLAVLRVHRMGRTAGLEFSFVFSCPDSMGSGLNVLPSARSRGPSAPPSASHDRGLPSADISGSSHFDGKWFPGSPREYARHLGAFGPRSPHNFVWLIKMAGRAWSLSKFEDH